MIGMQVDKTNIVEFLEIFDRIQQAKDSLQGKAPYHFNALLSTSILEPEVSSIMAGFFLQKNHGEYRILRSFVRTFWGDELAAKIKSPTILTEKTVKGDNRIDILIYEKDIYAIVLENKIWDAPDQPNQLANYIDAMMDSEFGFDKEQIFIAFMPKSQEHHPSCNSWTSRENGQSYQNEFEERYRLIDFKERILPWLESSKEILENSDNRHFECSRFLFIDFLRRTLEIDNIDNMAQKEIEKQLRDYFNTNNNAVADADKLLRMINILPKIDPNEVIKHLTTIRKEKTKAAMQEWVDRFKQDYTYTIHDDRSNAHMCVGVYVPYKTFQEFFHVFIWNFQNKDSLSVGIELTQDGTPYRKDIEPKVRNLVRSKKGFLKGHAWLYYKFVSYEQAYPLLQELVKELPNI